MRYTKNHAGKWIVPKDQWPEAAEKLAMFEDAEELEDVKEYCQAMWNLADAERGHKRLTYAKALEKAADKIIHAEEVTEINQSIADNTEHDNWMDIAQCEKCAEEHRQLAEWLKLLKRILDSGDCNDCAMLHRQCRYAPRIGELVRYNCPFYSQESEG